MEADIPFFARRSELYNAQKEKVNFGELRIESFVRLPYNNNNCSMWDENCRKEEFL